MTPLEQRLRDALAAEIDINFIDDMHGYFNEDRRERLIQNVINTVFGEVAE